MSARPDYIVSVVRFIVDDGSKHNYVLIAVHISLLHLWIVFFKLVRDISAKFTVFGDIYDSISV